MKAAPRPRTVVKATRSSMEVAGRADGTDASVGLEDVAKPFGRFFLPGPTEVRPEILSAQVRAMIGHRSTEIRDLLRRLQPDLRRLFGTEAPVMISTSSSTGMMEAALRNGARKRILALVNGAFSDRFEKIAVACGFETGVLAVPWGRPVTPGSVRRALAGGGYDAVTVVHSETSTGVLNPLREIAAVTRSFDDVVLLVDSVSGVGGTELLTDQWGLDFALAGSQKALALPPGLSFGVASSRMMERSAVAVGKGTYFDFVTFRRQLERDQTPNTPAISLLYALEAQLAAIRSEGLPARWARHRKMARLCAEWVEAMAEGRGVPLSILAPPLYRSPTVSCIRLPPSVAGPDVVRRMAERGFVIGSGYGRLKEGTIRIGHMGDHTPGQVTRMLSGLEGVILECLESSRSS